MAPFIATTSHQGPFPEGWASAPAPDPAMFGLPTDDDGSRDDPLLSQGRGGVVFQELDVEAIVASATRVIVAAVVESEGLVTERAAVAVAEALGSEVARFPGGHAGFLGGEFGQVGEPDAFAERLRALLDTG